MNSGGFGMGFMGHMSLLWFSWLYKEWIGCSEKSKQILIDTFAYNRREGINSFSIETMCLNQITDECHLNHNVPDGLIDVKGETVMS